MFGELESAQLLRFVSFSVNLNPSQEGQFGTNRLRLAPRFLSKGLLWRIIENIRFGTVGNEFQNRLLSTKIWVDRRFHVSIC